MRRALTTGEVAKYCGVHFRTVIRWVERGYIKAYKLPGRGDHRILVEDFIEFLKSNDMPVPEAFQSNRRRVLVVEDDPVTASIIEKLLKNSGFATAIASDGFLAGAMLGVFTPAVMTLDLSMPGLNGLDVLQHIKKESTLSRLKVLVVTAATDDDEIQKALDAGANDVISKPFDHKLLVEKVKQLVELPTDR
ncbi:MAG: response regulator [Gammaproteobacteria bacterium]|nr:response regulator [Gammaproteobacteria bacterium]